MAHIDYDRESRIDDFCAKCNLLCHDDGDFYSPPETWCDVDAIDPIDGLCPYRSEFIEKYPEYGENGEDEDDADE